MSVIRWEEPPPRTTGRERSPKRNWQPILDELRNHHGRWAIVAVAGSASVAANTAYHLNIRSSHHVAAFADAVGFEACCRTVGGEHRVYARYVGEADA